LTDTTIPSLPSLEYLDLDLSYYSSITVVPDLSTVPKLRSLIWGSSISDFSNLVTPSSLQLLQISTYDISDFTQFSSVISSLVGLIDLDVTLNFPIESYPFEVHSFDLSGATSIKYFKLSGRYLNDISEVVLPPYARIYNLYASILPDFSSLTNIEVLILDYSSLSDISCLSECCHTLKELDLSDTSVVDISALASFNSLVKLDLRWVNGISDISALSNQTSLKYLNLGGNNISDISPLSSLVNLEFLYLSNNAISDVSALSALSLLKVLHVDGNDISDISSFSALESITYLDIGDNSIIDASSLSVG
ncbi:leucine-rich repeat domain-containing protein, partial [Aduncisulcus paluster]